MALIGCEKPITDTPLVIHRCADAPISRASASAFVIGTDAYVLGGRIAADWSYPNDFYRYNPDSDTWTRLPDLPFEGRCNMVAITCGRKAYCGGGFAGEQKEPTSYKTDWWVFDGKAWQQLPDIPTRYTDGLISFALEDKIFIGYGYNHSWTAELFAFDTRTNTWSDNLQPDFSHLHLGFGYACAQSDQHLFAGLGFDTYNVNRWSEYDAASNSWIERASLPCKGGVFFAATATDSHVYIAGGRAFGGSLTGGQIYDHIWSYHIPTDTWAKCGTLPQPTENMIAFTIGRHVYFGLGEDADGKRLNHLYQL